MRESIEGWDIGYPRGAAEYCSFSYIIHSNKTPIVDTVRSLYYRRQ